MNALAARAMLAAAAAALLACEHASEPRSASPPLPREGRSLSDGRTVTLRAEGEAVVLNVWATWCGPCRREMASLESAHRELSSRGIRVVGVSVDRDELLAREFARRLGLSFTNLSDPDQRIVRDGLGVTRLPTTLGIGADGRVRWREETARDWADPSRLAWVRRSFGHEGP